MKKILYKIIKYIIYKCRFIIYEILSEHEKNVLKSSNDYILSKLKEKGEGIYFKGEIKITHPELVTIGSNVHIGENCYFHSDGGLLIGDNTHISRNVTIYTSNHNYNGDGVPYNDQRIYKPVFIEENVWIGMNVNISPGVTIGKGSILGLGAVITKNVPPYSVVGNQQYRIIKERDINKYKENVLNRKFGGNNGRLIKPTSLKSYKNLRNDRIFFVVGTGRSGSQSIARVLSTHPQIECKHEPKGRLIQLSTEYEHGKLSKSQVKNEIQSLFNSVSIISKEIYGESDQKYGNLIEIISEIFPEAKFIWLIRSARETITSTFSRGWFCDREFDYGYRKELCVDSVFSNDIYSNARLKGDLVDKRINKEDWKLMSPFERNCWYWDYWNKRIEKGLNNLSSDRKLIIKLNELQNNMEQIIEFLGANQYPLVNKSYNEAKYNLYNNWEIYQEDAYEKWCSESVQKWFGNKII